MTTPTNKSLNPDAHRRGYRHRINSGSDVFVTGERGQMIKFYVTHEERAAIVLVATRAKLDLGSWVRQQLFKALTTDDLEAGRQTVHQPKEGQ